MRNKYLIFLFIGCHVLLSSNAEAQNSKAHETENKLKKAADKFFEQENFTEAYPLYSQLLSLYPSDPDYNYRFGACILLTKADKEKALPYLRFAVKNPQVENEAYFYYGRALHLNYRFNQALGMYNKFTETTSSSELKKYPVKHYIEMCNNGIDLLATIHSLDVLRKKELNFSDFYNAYDPRPCGGSFVSEPEGFKTKLDIQKKISNVIFIPKGRDQIFYSSYGQDGKNGKDIYVVKRQPDGTPGPPQNLGSVINTSYDEDYPFYDAASHTLYFSSKGHNSMGGYDIFKSVYNENTQTWSQPVNLDFPINTPDDDILFITDTLGQTAFFSSTRSSLPGSIDVYKIALNTYLPDTLLAKQLQADTVAGSLAANNNSTDTGYSAAFINMRKKAEMEVSADTDKIIQSLAIMPHPMIASTQGNKRTPNSPDTIVPKVGHVSLDSTHAVSSVKNQNIAYTDTSNIISTNRVIATSKPDTNHTTAISSVNTIEPHNEVLAPDSSDNLSKESEQLNEKAVKAIDYAGNKLEESQELEQQAKDIFSASMLIHDHQQQQDSVARANALLVQSLEAYNKGIEAYKLSASLKSQAFVKPVKPGDLIRNQALQAKKDSIEIVRTNDNLAQEINELQQQSQEYITQAQNSNDSKEKLALLQQANDLDQSKQEKQAEVNVNNTELQQMHNKYDWLMAKARKTDSLSLSESKDNGGNIKPYTVSPDLQKEIDAYAETSDTGLLSYNNTDSANSASQRDASRSALNNGNGNNRQDGNNPNSPANPTNPGNLTNSNNNNIASAKTTGNSNSNNDTGSSALNNGNGNNREAGNNPNSPANPTNPGNLTNPNNNNTASANTSGNGNSNNDTGSSALNNGNGNNREAGNNPNSPTNPTNPGNLTNSNNNNIASAKTTGNSNSNNDTGSSALNNGNGNNRQDGNNPNNPANPTNPGNLTNSNNNNIASAKTTGNSNSNNDTGSSALNNGNGNNREAGNNPNSPANPGNLTNSNNNNIASGNTSGNSNSTSDTGSSLSNSRNSNSSNLQNGTASNNAGGNVQNSTFSNPKPPHNQVPLPILLSSIQYTDSNAYTITYEAERYHLAAGSLIDLAEKTRTDAREEKDAKAAAAKYEKADSLDRLMYESNLKGDEVYGEAGAKQYKANLDYVSYIDTVDDNGHFQQISVAKQLMQDAETSYNWSTEEKQKANEAVLLAVKRQYITSSDSDMTVAIVKQQRAAYLYFQVDSAKWADSPHSSTDTAQKTMYLSFENFITVIASKKTPGNRHSFVTANSFPSHSDSTPLIINPENNNNNNQSLQEAKTPVSVIRQDSNNTSITEHTVNAATNVLHPDTIHQNVIHPDFVPVPVATSATNDVFEEVASVPYTAAHPIPVDAPLPEGLIFKVQVGAFRKPIPQDLFKGFQPIVGLTAPEGFVRYQAGLFHQIDNARDALGKIKHIGYTDAFIVAYYNGKRITLKEALAMSGNKTGSNTVVVLPPSTRVSDTSQVNSSNISVNTSSVINTNPNAASSIKDTVPPPAQSMTSVKGLVFTVQVGAFRKHRNFTKLSRIKALYSLTDSTGITRYNSGIYRTIDEAKAAKDIIIANTIVKDAFVAAYYNGERISISQAQAMLHK